MFDPEKLIRKGLPKAHFKNLSIRSSLAFITYSVVLIAALLFGKIIMDGAPVLFKAEAPFVDFEFLTAKNETLHVFDDEEGVRHQLSASQATEYLKQHPGKEIYNEQTYSYSGGGIAGPIVGTALLTIGAIVIALFFGPLVQSHPHSLQSAMSQFRQS